MSRGKRRRVQPRAPESEIPRRRPRSERRAANGSPRASGRSWLPVAIGGLAVVIALAVGAFAMGFIPGTTGDADGTPTPLASPPTEPAGDGTAVTIETELGDIVIEIFTESSPVAAGNFVSLAESGFYDGVVFHRIVPGFVIQGGDPEGTGRGGPGYTIEDEPVVGDYVRGIVAMARTPAPNSQGSQFFIVLDDDVRFQLDRAGGYAIFGRVVDGMDVVDRIAAGPASQQMALEPVAMTQVTVQRP